MNKWFSAFLFSIAMVFQVGAQMPAPPNQPRLVNDFVKLLPPASVQELESFLLAYEDSTSNQFTVVIIATTEGDDINLFTAELGEKWGVGRSGKDNGAVLLVAVEDRKIAIQVGYGLEGALNDATLKLIIENIILPEFRKEAYGAGIEAGLVAMIQAAAGEFKGTGTKKPVGPENGLGFLGVLFIIFIIYLISRRNGGGPGGGIFLPPGPGGFGRHITYGGGFGGGGSGGGFGGFGGGSFGGGGASGSW